MISVTFIAIPSRTKYFLHAFHMIPVAVAGSGEEKKSAIITEMFLYK